MIDDYDKSSYAVKLLISSDMLKATHYGRLHPILKNPGHSLVRNLPYFGFEGSSEL